MSTQLDLKQIERKAFRATYQDGLWDIYMGLIVVFMAIFLYRPAEGYSPVNLVLGLLGILLAQILYRAGKVFITIPRLGQVTFGEIRKRKKITLAIIMGLFVLIQAGIVGLTALAGANPQVGAAFAGLFQTRDAERLAVATIGALMVGVGMILSAYFSDFPRGYFIAILMALAVFLMIYVNQPVFPILIGAVIILTGLTFLVRFLQQYPLRREEGPHE